jgi:hypothetical protein
MKKVEWDETPDGDTSVMKGVDQTESHGDDKIRAGDYLATVMQPFRLNERQTLQSDYEVPRSVLEETELLLAFVREAIRVGKSS